LLYRRSLVEHIGRWAPNLPVIQDARFLFEAAAAGARFVHVPGVGAYYRISPGSLSRRNKALFIADCATNTQEIEWLWHRQGTLTDARRAALASMWGHVATSALLNGLPEFEVARDGFNRAGRKRAAFEIGSIIRHKLGASQTAMIATAAQRVKSVFCFSC